MTSWRWAVGPNGGDLPTREMTTASGRVVTWRVAGHAFAQFGLDARHDEAAAVTVRESDLWIWRDSDLVFRGRVAGAFHAGDASTHRVQFSAVDYRAMLSVAAKVEPPVPTFSAVDQGQIPWELIEDWQSLDGGDWGIVEGVGGTSGTTRDETDITPGAPVGEVIDRLANRDGGFEWAIEPDADGVLELNRWHPTRGSDNAVVLDYGGLLTGFESGSGEFANAAVVTGDQSTTPETAQTADVATDARGRWTTTQSFPTVSQQATLAAKATWAVDQASTAADAWTLRMAPTRWGGRSHLWIGDTARLRIRSGMTDVADPVRVVEIQVVLDGDGGEVVTLGAVGVPA